MAGRKLFQTTCVVIFGCLSSYVLLACIGDMRTNTYYAPTGVEGASGVLHGKPTRSAHSGVKSHWASKGFVPYVGRKTTNTTSYVKKASSALIDLYEMRLRKSKRNYPKTLDYSNIHNISSANQFGLSNRTKNSRGKRGDERKNILFIVVDDLRPQLNAYSSLFASPEFTMHTPNIDALAARSLVLSNAFVQYSSCNPSRASYMTSRRPDTTKVWDLTAFWRVSGGNFTTIPQFYKDRGYRAAGLGKIYHPGKAGGYGDPISWTERFFLPPHGGYWADKANVPEFWRAVSKQDREINPLPDEEILVQSIRRLHIFTARRHRNHPFFLAVGFQKPHLPIVVPEEFINLYSLGNIPLANHPFTPQNFPRKSFYPNLEVMNCSDVWSLNGSYFEMNETFPDSFSRVLRRAYFAGVSYVDYLIGILLDELRTLGLDKSTIVTFIGDHGWHLGENAIWGKHSNFDRGVQAPMMIHYPRKTDRGLRSDSLVEFTDLFPTLVELSGHGDLAKCPPISADIPLCTEGRSFASLISKPGREFRKTVYSQHRYPKNAMGYSVRSARYRYTEMVYVRQDSDAHGMFHLRVDWKNQFGTELYDHESDPDENINVVNKPKYSRVRKELEMKLHAHFASYITNVTIPMFYYKQSKTSHRHGSSHYRKT